MNKTLYNFTNSCYNENATNGSNNRAFSKGFVLSPVRGRKGSKAESFRECLSYLRCIMGNIICGIYGIFNIESDKVYIGKSKNFKARISQHLSELRLNKHGNSYLQRAFNKWGEEPMIFVLLEICTKEKLLEREQYYIDLYDSINPNYGYNLETAYGKFFAREEVKQKFTLSRKGKKLNLSKEQREKWVEIRKGRIPWNKGKKMTKEYCENNRQGQKGKRLSDECKRKKSEAMKKYKHLTKEWELLREQGYSLVDISKQYNVLPQIISNYTPGNYERRRYTTVCEEWKNLYKTGYSIYQIGEKYNVSPKTIKVYLRREECIIV